MSGSLDKSTPSSSVKVGADRATGMSAVDDRWNALMTAAQNGDDRAYEQLMVEAILEQSEAKALRALTMSPLVQNIAQARAVLKQIWPSAMPSHDLS